MIAEFTTVRALETPFAARDEALSDTARVQALFEGAGGPRYVDAGANCGRYPPIAANNFVTVSLDTGR